MGWRGWKRFTCSYVSLRGRRPALSYIGRLSAGFALGRNDYPAKQQKQCTRPSPVSAGRRREHALRGRARTSNEHGRGRSVAVGGYRSHHDTIHLPGRSPSVGLPGTLFLRCHRLRDIFLGYRFSVTLQSNLPPTRMTPGHTTYPNRTARYVSADQSKSRDRA